MKHSGLWALALLQSFSPITLASGESINDPVNETLRWGPYRPNLYFGIRPQIPKTLLLGLMWGNIKEQTAVPQNMRNTCEQDDKMDGYGWTMYDTRVGGIQKIRDTENHVDIKTEFLKTPDGENWGARITGVPLADAPADTKTMLVFHVAMEDMPPAAAGRKPRKIVSCQSTAVSEVAGRKVLATCDGRDPLLKDFRLRVFGGKNNRPLRDPDVMSTHVPESRIWRAKSGYQPHLDHPFDSPD